MDDTRGPGRAVPQRRQKPAEQATGQARKLLGELLQARRGELGHPHRTTFGEERGLNWRLITDIESAYRDSFTIGTLAKVAQAYEVTRESVLAVLSGDADKLEPVAKPSPLAAAPDPIDRGRPQGSPGSWISPETIACADRQYMPAIRERLAALADRGIADPAGDELFPDDPGLAGAYEADRLSGSDAYAAAWMAALVQERRERLRGAGRGPRHGSAGA